MSSRRQQQSSSVASACPEARYSLSRRHTLVAPYGPWGLKLFRRALRNTQEPGPKLRSQRRQTTSNIWTLLLPLPVLCRCASTANEHDMTNGHIPGRPVFFFFSCQTCKDFQATACFFYQFHTAGLTNDSTRISFVSIPRTVGKQDIMYKSFLLYIPGIQGASRRCV